MERNGIRCTGGGGPPRESGCGTCRLERRISNRGGMRKLGFMGALGALAATALTVAATAMAATTVVVTQNTTTWTQDDTRGGGTVTWTSAYGAPAGLGHSSLQLATTADPGDKAGLHTHTMAGTPL